MSDMRDLYQEVILDHNKRPRNFRILPATDPQGRWRQSAVRRPDQRFLDIEDGVIKDIAFQGAGCAISSASASLMTEALKGKKVDDVGPLFDAFHTS
jgi:nitrogen fixation NifU-like protein